MAPDFNPTDYTAAEVIDHLSGVRSGKERDRILSVERMGQNRVSVFNEHPGFDREARRDSSGRILNAWEVAPADQVTSEPTETDEGLVQRQAALPGNEPQLSQQARDDEGDDADD